MPIKSKLKLIAAPLLVILFIGIFVDYIGHHPAIIDSLSRISPWLLVILLGCYILLLFWWMAVYNATLNLCSQPLPRQENLLLTIYSTLANFFLPLQSGPGVRAAYLKKRHNVSVAGYIMASLIYFAMYAIISAGFLFIASRYWWLSILAVIAAALISLFVLRQAQVRFKKRALKIHLDLNRIKLLRLFAVTCGQLLTQALIYGIEIHSLHTSFSIARVISYTGAANFSLFVSLTPGAIGFREAFLEFSRQLHHFSTTTILAANVIDRGVFIAFLGILFIVMLLTHTGQRLRLKSWVGKKE